MTFPQENSGKNHRSQTSYLDVQSDDDDHQTPMVQQPCTLGRASCACSLRLIGRIAPRGYSSIDSPELARFERLALSARGWKAGDLSQAKHGENWKSSRGPFFWVDPGFSLTFSREPRELFKLAGTTLVLLRDDSGRLFYQYLRVWCLSDVLMRLKSRFIRLAFPYKRVNCLKNKLPMEWKIRVIESCRLTKLDMYLLRFILGDTSSDFARNFVSLVSTSYFLFYLNANFSKLIGNLLLSFKMYLRQWTNQF